MIDIAMDMEQYDCPFIDTTAEHAVSFSTLHWDFDSGNRELETRMVVQADRGEALDDGLQTLREHPNMHDFDLTRRWGTVANIHTVIDETDAMGTIRAHEGYITGPFYVEDGSETWHVGFDSPDRADETLAHLERNNEFDVRSRQENSLPDHQTLARHGNEAVTLLEACRALSTVERETLAAAINQGYFESPRGTTLGDLADEFDISKPAISKNLRRSQRKVIERVVEVAADLERQPGDGTA